LIPLTHPQYVGTKRMQGFKQYLHHAIENSDALIAISKTVQEDVQEYIRLNRSHFRRVPKDVLSFTLGAELSLVEGGIRSELQALFKRQRSLPEGNIGSLAPSNPYLMVATFDPRKNHHYLLDAFDRIWQNRSDLKLCLIGRVGSLCADVIDRIEHHPRLNKQLFLFNDIKDCELQYCYQNCRGVIFPSIVEGFGLPIVESLWFGKRTFASDTPIHREVGQKDCIYFDLESPDSLVQQIEAWEAVADRTNTLPSRKLTSWEDSSRQLMDQCLAVHGRLRMGEPAAIDCRITEPRAA
jgi:O-antigen biosynthesis alpha-1,2-rhamnosyltransferase